MLTDEKIAKIKAARDAGDWDLVDVLCEDANGHWIVKLVRFERDLARPRTNPADLLYWEGDNENGFVAVDTQKFESLMNQIQRDSAQWLSKYREIFIDASRIDPGSAKEIVDTVQRAIKNRAENVLRTNETFLNMNSSSARDFSLMLFGSFTYETLVLVQFAAFEDLDELRSPDHKIGFYAWALGLLARILNVDCLRCHDQAGLSIYVNMREVFDGYASELRKLDSNAHVPAVKEAVRTETSAKSGGGCFVATTVEGDYGHPNVLVLREFRDKTLAFSTAGRLFIRIYYKVGPSLANLIGHSSIARSICRRVVILPAVRLANRALRNEHDS